MEKTYSVDVPFRLNQHAPLILLSGYVNGHGPVDMILDTGASATVIAREVAENAGMQLQETSREATGAHGSHQVVMTELERLAIGDLQVKDLKVAVMDLAHINQKARMNAGAVLGYDFLRRYEVTINYAGRWVRFNSLTHAAAGEHPTPE